MKLKNLTIAILSLGIAACNDQNELLQTTTENQFQSVVTADGAEELMEFAPATENPYTIESMQLALEALQQDNELECEGEMFNIRPTHKYVKFMPQDSIQFSLLLDDSTLILFDYPMDRKLVKAGTYYLDPTVESGRPNFQWTCVPIEKELSPAVPFEVISVLYLPEEDPELVQYYDTPADECITVLVEKAMQLTGTFDTTENRTTVTTGGESYKWRGRRPAKWTPAGKITMQDNALGRVPIKGCKVRVVRWFEVREKLTDVNGNFNMGHQFRNDVNYSIKWDRNDFEIRHKYIAQAYFNGPKQKGDWNLHITSGYSNQYAIVHRAAHRYYYEGENARAGLKTPPLRKQMLGRLKIGAFTWNDNSRNRCGMAFRFLDLPEITIMNPNRGTQTVFCTTIHELAHASHWNLGKKNDFNFGDDVVVESWARGAQYAIGRLEYSGYTPSLDNLYSRMQYTGIVEDMIDGFKKVTSNRWWDFNLDKSGSPLNLKSYNDSLSGYTARQIEDALKGQRKWNDWKNNIKNKYNNATKHKLDEAFDYWNTK